MLTYCALINTHAQRGDVGGADKYLKQTVKAGQVSNLSRMVEAGLKLELATYNRCPMILPGGRRIQRKHIVSRTFIFVRAF